MENLISVLEHTDKSFKVVSEFEGWKVALMNDMEKYKPENIACMQKHNLSDEIFVLLSGKCTLFVATGDEMPQEVTAVPMEQGKVYSIKKGVWHTHTFHENTQVFIVENSNTNDGNSPRCFDLTPEQKEYIKKFG